MSHRILLVENDDRLCGLFEPALAEAGHWVVRVRTGLEALSRLTPKAPPVDLVVTEVDLGGGPDGWQVARRARLRWPGLPVIYLAKAPSDERLPQQVPLGALLPRPFPLNQLVEMARHLMVARAEARFGHRRA
jgi:DNA-binding response OmpR family regulator